MPPLVAISERPAIVGCTKPGLAGVEVFISMLTFNLVNALENSSYVIVVVVSRRFPSHEGGSRTDDCKPHGRHIYTV